MIIVEPRLLNFIFGCGDDIFVDYAPYWPYVELYVVD